MLRWDYMDAGGSLSQDMDRLIALDRGMRTWARWVDANVDATKTRVFFQSISPTHYKYSLSLSLSLSLSHYLFFCLMTSQNSADYFCS